MIFDLIDESADKSVESKQGQADSSSDSLLFTLNNELQTNSSEIVSLALDQIIPDPEQPRRSIEDDSLIDLAQSIQENGLLQPIVVQTADHDGYFKIIIGERRWRAHHFTDREQIPVIIRSPNDTDILALQIIENNQREDVPPLEEAKALKKMVELANSKKDVAEAIGRSPSWLSKRLALLNAPAPVQSLAKTSAVQDINTLNSLTKLHQKDPNAAEQLINEAKEGNNEGGLRARVEEARKQVADDNVEEVNNETKTQIRSHSDPFVELVKQFKQRPISQLVGIEKVSLPLVQLEKKFRQFLQLQSNLKAETLDKYWSDFVREHKD